MRIDKGFAGVAERSGADAYKGRRACAFANEIKAAGLNNVVVLGMGGSSLAPELLSLRTFPGQRVIPNFRCSTRPIRISVGGIREVDRARKDNLYCIE